MANGMSLNTELGLVCKPEFQRSTDSAAQQLSSKLFRVFGIEREKLDNIQFRNEALIGCTEATLRVSWLDNVFVSRVYPGQIVSPRFSKVVASENGCTSINRLVVYERPDAHANLFELVPHAWVKDRDLVNRAAVLLAELPELSCCRFQRH